MRRFVARFAILPVLPTFRLLFTLQFMSQGGFDLFDFQFELF
jgi:hypothetical protein